MAKEFRSLDSARYTEDNGKPMAHPCYTAHRNLRTERPLNPALVFACLAGILGAAWAIAGGGRPAAPLARNSAPGAPSRPPYDPNQTRGMVAFFAQRSRSDRRDWISLNLLAGDYLQLCRETGDIGDAVRAEQAARRSLAVFSRANDGARSQLAMSLLTQHRFPEALSTLTPAGTHRQTVHRPDSPQTALLRAEITMEMGDYEAAHRALNAAASGEMSPNQLALRARMLEIDGQPLRAIERMRQAAALADQNIDMPASSVSWYHMRVGNLLEEIGHADEAELAYRQSLAIFPRDHRTLTLLARLAAGRGDWPAVLDWGGRSAAVVPTPEVVALLGDAYTALGKRDQAEEQYGLVDTIAKLTKAQRAIYDRQRALFCADHDRNLEEALGLARRELSVRHDIYAYDTLAWVCCKCGRIQEGRAAMAKALRRGTQDARLFYHAGCLAMAAGDQARAREYFTSALKLNPYFLPFAPDNARRLLAGMGRR